MALVTGAGSGLGRALVARFLDEGARGIGVLEYDATKAQKLSAWLMIGHGEFALGHYRLAETAYEQSLHLMKQKNLKTRIKNRY